MGALRFAPGPTGDVGGAGDATFDAEYFGDGSGVSFHSLILQHFFLGPHPHPPASETLPRHSAPPGNPLRTGVIVLADLPTPAVARELFDYYFTHIHRLYPFLHEASIRESYDVFWEKKEVEDVSSSFTLGSVMSQLALHLSVFAMADKLRNGKITHNCELVSGPLSWRPRS